MLRLARCGVSLAIVALLACSNQHQYLSQAQINAYEARTRTEEAEALELVQARADAKSVVISFPAGQWSVESDHQQALETNASRVYCPHEYDVYYGEVNSNEIKHDWQWHVNVAVDRVSDVHDLAALIASPGPLNTPFNFEEGERVDLCYDGKAPAVADPEADPTFASDVAQLGGAKPALRPLSLIANVPDTWKATVSLPTHASLTHGELTIRATYPVYDYNSSRNATRFRAMLSGKVITDKLVDEIPTDIRIAKVEGGDEVAILDDFSGGAHCCFGSALIDPGLNGEDISFTTIGWGNVGYTLRQSADGSGYVFKSGDDALAYAFSSFAGSTFPILIVAYRDGKFIDVTNEYPDLVHEDAKTHWKEYLTDAASNIAPDSAIVAFLADEYRLRNQDTAWKYVRNAEGDRADFYTSATAWLKKNGYMAK